MADKTPRKRVSKVSADEVARLQREALLEKLKADQPLTSSQMAFLTGDSAAGVSSGFASSHVALAKAVGVTRQTIHKYARRKDAPKPTSNGKHDIVAWRMYLAKVGAISGVADSVDGEVLDKELKRLRAALLTVELAKENRELIPMSEHIRKLTFVAERSAAVIKKLPERIAAYTRDHALVEMIRKECSVAAESALSEMGVLHK